MNKYYMKIEVPKSHRFHIRGPEGKAEVEAWIRKILTMTFKDLSLFINHDNPTLSSMAKERLTGSLNNCDLAAIVDADIHGIYALFQMRLDL